MNSIKEKLKQEFLADIVLSECPKTITIITSQNAANLIDFLSKKNIPRHNVDCTQRETSHPLTQ